MQIMIRPGFTTAAECGRLVEQIREVKTSDPTVRTTRVRSEMSAISLMEHGDDTVAGIRSRVLAELSKFFGLDDLWLECTILSEMRAGDRVPLHADNERRVAEKWEPNHTPHRSHAAILYLNSAGPGGGYSGGSLRFPSRELEVIPAAGTLVAFPCDRRFEHEVGVVEDGDRYTLAIWCTTLPDHEEPWM
uniref:2OG-Fe(II) oxygenase n=1 Tax=Herbidospora sakaeratensis TaxID=564415 RepID=UPI000B1223F9|nr:2OG-Fe(II) oxygenase [Herbidospora sakaeratensis]